MLNTRSANTGYRMAVVTPESRKDYHEKLNRTFMVFFVPIEFLNSKSTHYNYELFDHAGCLERKDHRILSA